MSTKAFVPAGFLILLFGAFVKATSSGAVVPAPPQLAVSDPAEPGVFPSRWVNGVDCVNEPEIQVHRFNENLYILRQSKCAHFEAPFIYLIFGSQKVLMIDTGSSPTVPWSAAVSSVITFWEQRNNGGQPLDLVVAHSHSHFDHIQGDAMMALRPNTTVVGVGFTDVVSYFGFTNWPNQNVQYDLGGRVLEVIPTPGHHSAGITFYDPATELLLTGDTIYPGHLFVFGPAQWPVFQASALRLRDFAVTHPVSWVLGCHIEMSSVPFGCLTWGTTSHPDEHVLELRPEILQHVLDAATALGPEPVCGSVQEHFVIHPVWVCPITGGC